MEKALPRPKECELEKRSRLYKAYTRAGSDGFHPMVHLDLTKETRGEVVDLLERWNRVENGRNKLAQRCSS